MALTNRTFKMQGIILVAIFILDFQECLANSYACTSTGYTLSNELKNCYKFFETRKPFSEARRNCEDDGATLLRIDSMEENEFINSSFSSFSPFWIGLSDTKEEGKFQWTNADDLQLTSFRAWVGGDGSVTNADNFDCVKFTQQGLWGVHQDFCENAQLPFVCRLSACNSTDGETCEENPGKESSTSLGGGVIAVIVVIPLIIIIIIIIVFVLLYLWKYQNDFFNKYICCCIVGSSKAQMNSLKQEIQRLQTELSQQKLNSSGRFQSLSRQQTQVSLTQPSGFNRSISSNKILPLNTLPSSATMQPPTVARPSQFARGSSMSLIKTPLPALSEENKGVDE